MFEIDIKQHVQPDGYTLENISLNVEEGQFISITGSSGSGKSLLFSLCAGLIDPTDGDVKLDNHSLFIQKEIERVHKNMGVIFQIPALISNLSIHQNIKLPIEQHYFNLSDKEKNNLVDKEAENFHLGSSLDMRPGTVSNGKQERAAIARAIVTTPKIILWDSPLLYTDEFWNTRIIDRFSELKKQGVSVIIFTNHQSELLDIFDTHYKILNSTLEPIDGNL
jgi:ABC-type lipoprotein export system ATPase subunit